MTQQVSIPTPFGLMPRGFGISDDFDYFVTGDRWTDLSGDGGSWAVSDAVGGIIAGNPGGGTPLDNDEAYLHGNTEIFLFADEKPLEAQCRLQFTEAATDDANILFGFMDAWGANSLQDNGGGPPDSYSGAVIFKLDGETVWRFETSLTTAQTTTASRDTAGGAGNQSLMIRVMSSDDTTVELSPWIDPNGGQDFKQMKDANDVNIKHFITLGSPTEMAIGFGVKNGSANQETLNVDWVWAQQLR